MSRPFLLFPALAIFSAFCSASAEIQLPSIFCDHMVIQRDVPVQLWGTANAGEQVSLTAGGKTISGVAGGDGKWKLTAGPFPIGQPLEIQISGQNTITLKDVLVGEVWLASGQSNMDFTVARTKKYYFAGTANAEAEIAAANHPNIRMWTADWTMRDQPQPSVPGSWKVCTPENVREFSAVGYFFARELQKELNVPVGIITCTFGASTAQAWIGRDALQEQPELAPMVEKFDQAVAAFRQDAASLEKYKRALARWEKSTEETKATGGKPPRKPRNPDPVQDQHNPTVLFNGMIAPIIPYAIRGAIWYQGESNAGDAKIYPRLQKTLIAEWRGRWGLGDFPFYFVQLASNNAPKPDPAASRLASFRDAQSRALEEPNTGMAVTIDIGDAKDVHPRNKQDVGRRLSLIALAKTYGKNVEYSGPVLDGMKVEGNAIRLRFQHVGGGLVAKDGPLKQFAIAGSDRKYVWADAKIDGETVVVSSPDVAAPVSVSYAWADNPEGCNLYNAAGLPAVPFRTGEK